MKQNSNHERLNVLGAFGSNYDHHSTTCVQVCEKVLIDAGSVMESLGDKVALIDHIFLTHAHFDHISDLPYIIDVFFEKRDKPLKIYGLKDTLKQIKDHIFNWHIWPDFSALELAKTKTKAIEYIEIEPGVEYEVEDIVLKPVKTCHTVESCGYVISKNNKKVFFTSDTYKCDSICDEINVDKEIKTLIIEVSFPSRLEKLAKLSNHLTPKLLSEILEKLQRNDIKVYINHLKPIHMKEIIPEIEKMALTRNGGKILKDNDHVYF